MFKRLQKGFTLIELLVVIAIIGILSSVVLASLNTARNKGADASVKASLANARAQAELYYDGQSPNSYSGVCTNSTSGIGNMLTSAANASGSTVSAQSAPTAFIVGDATHTTCHDQGGSTSGWVASAPLKAVTPQSWWCVDSTGKSKSETAALAVGDIACQ